MSRSVERDYAIARAVWLYQRFCRMLADRHAGNNGLKAQALGQRLNRWLVGADAIERAGYYRAICELDQTETTHARVARRRGRQVIQMAVASADADERERAEHDYADE